MQEQGRAHPSSCSTSRYRLASEVAISGFQTCKLPGSLTSVFVTIHDPRRKEWSQDLPPHCHTLHMDALCHAQPEL